MNSKGERSTSKTDQVKAFVREAVLRLLDIMTSAPAYLVRTVVVYAIITAILLRVFKAQASTSVSPIVTILCACVGLSAIVVYRRWSARFGASETALTWSRGHFQALGLMLLLSIASCWIDNPIFSYPVLPLIGLSLLVVGTQLLLRAFLLDYFLRIAGSDGPGTGATIALNAVIVSAFALKGDDVHGGGIILESLANYVYLKTSAFLPVLIFFSAAVAMQNSATLMAGLVAMATYYAVMIVSSLVARPEVVSGVSEKVGTVGTD